MAVTDDHAVTSVEFAAITRSTVQIFDLLDYETINPRRDLQVRFQVSPQFELTELQAEYSCDEGNSWDSAGTIADLSDPLFPKVTIAGGTFTRCQNIRLRFDCHQGISSSQLVRNIRAESTLLDGFPVAVPWPTLDIGSGPEQLWPGNMQPAIGDVMGDSDAEIVLATAGYEEWGAPARILIYSRTGDLLRTLPLTGSTLQRSGLLGMHSFALATSGLLLLDLDRDGKLDIIVPAVNTEGPDEGVSGIFAMRADGSLLPGWPVDAASELDYSLTANDLDNDGRPEIIFGAESGTRVRILNYLGQEVAHFQTGNNRCHQRRYTWSPVSLPIVFQSIALGNKQIISVVSNNICGSTPDTRFVEARKEIGVYSPEGVRLDGWTIPRTFDPIFSYSTPFSVTGANIDGMGDPEILFPSSIAGGSEIHGLYAYHRTGELLTGFPVLGGPNVYSIAYSSSAGDVNGDGIPEALIATRSGQTRLGALNAIQANGTELPGWPGTRMCNLVNRSTFGSDLVFSTRMPNGDPAILEMNGSCIMGRSSDAQLLPTYPRQQAAFTSSFGAGALDDLDRDGHLEFINVASQANYYSLDPIRFARLYGWETEFASGSQSTDWLKPRRDRYHSGVLGQEPQELFSIGGVVSFRGTPLKGMVVEDTVLGRQVTDNHGAFRLEHAKLGHRYELKAHLPQGGVKELLRENPLLSARPKGQVSSSRSEMTIAGESRWDFTVD